MEDWEQFFTEKSKRRAEKVRSDSSRKWIQWGIAAWIFLLIAVLLMMIR